VVRERRDRERARRRGDDRVVGGVSREPGEERGLHVVVLGDRLDQERPVREVRELGRVADALGVDLTREPAAHLVDRLLRPRDRRVRARPEQNLAVPGGGCREAARDGPAAGYSEVLVHWVGE
jgi:hypothetical protein